MARSMPNGPIAIFGQHFEITIQFQTDSEMEVDGTNHPARRTIVSKIQIREPMFSSDKTQFDDRRNSSSASTDHMDRSAAGRHSINFVVNSQKPLSRITAADVPPGLDAEDVATDAFGY